MVERIRTEFQRVFTGEGGGKRMSQAELDAYRRQLVLLGLTVGTVLLVLILGIGAFYQYVYLPGQSVAEVGGEDVERSDYWDYRQYQLLLQINQYQQMAQFMEGEQAEQYQQLAFQANQEFDDIENADIDPMTVDEMINNRIVMDSLDEFDIEITDEEIDEYLVEYFAGTPIGDEEAGPEADPTAEAWATATAETQQEEAEAQQEDAEDAEENGEETEENGEDDAEDEESADDESEEEATPTPEPTPAEEDIRATAEANQADHQEFLLDRADMSEDQFIDMVIRPELAREKIQNRLAEDVPARTEQVQAAHILVATEDAANQVYETLTGDDAPEFAEVAEEQSTDTQTAPNGGDLGWFPRGVMVPEFDETIFELDEGEISEPFETEFGWHVATVLEREEDRPVQLQVLQQLRQQAFDEWLEEQRDEIDIDADVDLPEDPGAAPGQFQPPAGAPQPPQPDPQQQQPEMDVEVPEGEQGDEGDDGDEGEDEEQGDEESDDFFDGDDPFEDSESDED